MPESTIPQEAINAVAPALAEGGIPMDAAAPANAAPVFKVSKDSKIPVSKQFGKLWKSRRNHELQKRRKKVVEENWNEALDYYQNDQVKNRITGTEGNYSRNEVLTKEKEIFSSTENIVFANTNSLVPLVYSKTPSVEITPVNPENEQLKLLASLLERCVLRIFEKAVSPGIALKTKAKRAVVLALLTNSAFLVLDFINREASSEQALAELNSIAEKMKSTKTTSELIELEGQLIALEEKIALLRPKGFKATIKLPHEVVYDTVGGIDNIKESRWLMYSEFIQTNYLKAVYMDKGDSSEDYKSIFEPTHVATENSSSGGEHDSIEEDSLYIFDGERRDASHFGYADDTAFKAAQLTKCWWVWDLSTRRLALFNDKNWTWPLWVWDDPLGLEEFYPVYQLSFYSNPEGGDCKGEVSYYLDQQDTINEINSEVRKGRSWAINNVFFDSNTKIAREDVEKLMTGGKDNIVAVDVPEGKTIEQCIASFIPPALKHPEFFDKQSTYQAIDRISSVKVAMQGTEFKTNTTNQAIQTYSQGVSNILDSRIDVVEDWIGEIGYGIVQLLLMNYSAEEISQLVGFDAAQIWQQMPSQEIASTFSCRVVGGSTIKPTSASKRQEALQIGQVLGQYASASPVVVLMILKQFEQAFDSITISPVEWEMLIQSIQMQMQPQGGDPTQQGGVQGGQQVPPEVEQAIQSAVKQGVPPDVARQEIMKRFMESQQQGAAQSAPQEQPQPQQP